MTTLDNLFDRCSPEPNSGCWIWLGAMESGGYGSVRVGRDVMRAHRLSYRLAKGPVEGGFVLHHCDNRLCINPDHLYLGTKLDNARDRERRGRGADRSLKNNGRAVVDPSIVAEIRASSATEKTLAQQYGIARSTVGRIRRMETW